MKLVIITDPEFIPGEAAIINRLFQAGMTCLHVRKPESKEAAFKALLSQIDSAFLDKVAIHQHHQLAEMQASEGCILRSNTEKLTSPEKLEPLVRKELILSTSVHDPDEINRLSPLFSYTFFGPVFDSISKKGLRTSLPDHFMLKPELKKIPVIGLGGINNTNLHKIGEMNLDGAAVLGAIWQNPALATAKLAELQHEINTEYKSGAHFITSLKND